MPRSTFGTFVAFGLYIYTKHNINVHITDLNMQEFLLHPPPPHPVPTKETTFRFTTVVQFVLCMFCFLSHNHKHDRINIISMVNLWRCLWIFKVCLSRLLPGSVAVQYIIDYYLHPSESCRLIYCLSSLHRCSFLPALYEKWSGPSFRA